MIKQTLWMMFCALPFVDHKPINMKLGYTKCSRCGVSMHIDEEYIRVLDPYCSCKKCISCVYYAEEDLK